MSGTLTGTPSRSFETTYPWISFRLDLSRLDYHLWVDLGAIQSKVEHVANALLPPDIAKKLRTLYLAKGVHGTTAIEGNSLTEDQVHDRIANKTRLPESQEYLGQAIDNVAKACTAIWRQVLSEKMVLTSDRIRAFNRMVLEGLPLAEHVRPGEFRKCSVVVANYNGPHWEEVPFLVERLCRFLDVEFVCPDRQLVTGFAVLKAIVAHLYIAWIHPFGDGNGRTARLLEFQILLSGGVPTIAAHLLSNFYNQTRDKYYTELAAASRSPEGMFSFLRYALQGFRDQLDEQIRHIREFQWAVVWRDCVYERFRGHSGPVVHRRRLFALELPRVCSVEASKLRRLTPEIAELYAGRTGKTLTRDINELEKMNLIVREGKIVCVNGALLAQFLPGRKVDHDSQNIQTPTPSDGQ